MIRVGLIGAGFIGRNHYNQYEKLAGRAKVVALCDSEPDRRAGDWSKVGGNIADAQGTKRDLGNIKPYGEWQDLIADSNVDMVDVCTPTFLHPEMVMAALREGKHVLCEKPMALTVEECDQMLETARNARGRFMIAQVIRFWPEYVYLRQVFQSKEFGVLRAVQFRRQATAPTYSLNDWLVNPVLSGGAIMDLHIHDVDYMVHLLGKPASVHAQAYQRTGSGYDRVHAVWTYRPELVVQVEGCWDLPPGFPFNMGFTAVFEDASIVWDLSSGNPMTVYRKQGDPLQPKLPAVDGYCAEIEYFLDCIENGTDPTVTTPRESREAVAIALAEKRSALSGKPVDLP